MEAETGNGTKRTIADYFGPGTSKEPENKKIKSNDKGKRSIFWKYFVKLPSDKSDNEKATCDICKRTISLGGRGRHANTSNLKSHLEKYHYKEFCNVTGKGKLILFHLFFKYFEF